MPSHDDSPAMPALFTGLDVDDARAVWESALCAQVDPELFFPEKGSNATSAKAVCTRCPVTALCLATFGPLVDYGVVGGLTVRERSLLRRAGRRRAERPDEAAA
jgi:WhiB family transcriptional regulator, redox-sensing transcriptional regulator